MVNNNGAPEKKTPKPPSERSFASGYTAGLNLLSSVIVGVVLGLGLDVWLGTKPLFILVLMFFGIAAGFRGIWVYMQSMDDHKNSD